MKKLTLLLLTVPSFAFAQLNEGFESGNIIGWEQSDSSRWAASTKEAISGVYSLHHVYDNPVAGHDQVSIPLQNIRLDSATTTWRFKVRHGYPPSASNNWGVFLLSDMSANQMYPSGLADGYVVGVNYSGSDDMVKLWKVNSGAGSAILNTGFNWQEKVHTLDVVGFEVIRTASGFWEVQIDTTGGFNDLVRIGTVTDNRQILFNHFGIYYEYSSSQDMKLWIDDVSIEGYIFTDSINPTVKEIGIVSSNSLELLFSEPVDPNSASDKSNYSVDNGVGIPLLAQVTQPDRVLLTFQNSFIDEKDHLLLVENVADLYGNVITPVYIPFFYYLIKPYDIVINEIMADPHPALDLPESEFIELYNITAYSLRLNGWSIQIGSANKHMNTIDIPPESYIILCSPEVVQDFSPYGLVTGINGFPVIPNTGQTIALRNENLQVISSVTYSDKWYGDDYKSEGGWSLEQIDPFNPCGGEGNWIASTDIHGGTPGKRNSVMDENPDLESPLLINAYLLSDSSLVLYFNEPYDSVTAIDPSVYNVDNGIGDPVYICLDAPTYRAVVLYFDKKFQAGEIYTITVENSFADCAGNPLYDMNSRRFGIPERADSLDILLNEVLFNPPANGVDYVEVYNRSGKLLDFKELRIASRDDITGKLKSVYSITEFPYLFFPEEYFVFSTDASRIFQQYYAPDPWHFIDLEKMPSFPDDKGRVVLTNQGLQVLDEFEYREEMHFPLLQFTEGVSLERISFSRPTTDASNWHSAAEDVGFGTPGYENSQHNEDPAYTEEIIVEPEVFSPDNDGYHDVVTVAYKFDRPGMVATITIFDSRGRVVRHLLNNELLGIEGSFTWDGINEENRLAGIGIYVFYIEIFDLNGTINRYKKTCVLAKRLNR